MCLLASASAKSNTETLKKAAGAFREALTVFDQQRLPYYWQMAQKNLYHTLVLIAERQSQTGASAGK